MTPLLISSTTRAIGNVQYPVNSALEQAENNSNNSVVPTTPNVPSFTILLAHEVRNPLTSINLAVELLKSEIKDEELNILLDIIVRNSDKINSLVTEILNKQIEKEAVPSMHFINELLDEVLEVAGDRLKLKHIIVRKDYYSPDFEMLIDKPKMKIALTNIVINAIDAMASESGELCLLTTAIDKHYVLKISDNGKGISHENIDNIFKPYFTNRPGGMGLGLSTTLDILTSNHTSVGVESEPGIGTNFILSFDKDQQQGNSQRQVD